MRLFLTAFLAASLPLSAQSWNQWGGNPRHTGSIPVVAQPFRTQLAEFVYDPFAPLNRQVNGGSLLVHYQTPLSDGREVFMVAKGGEYTHPGEWQTQTWSMRKYAWENGQLVEKWTSESDWDPVPWGPGRWEPVFHGALANGFVYLPARGGTVLEINRETGSVERRLGAFHFTLNDNVYVTGPIAVSDNGTLYYNTVELYPVDPWTSDIVDAWLVRIKPDGTASRVSFRELVTGAPAANGQCTGTFTSGQQPFPPSPDAVAPTVTCGSQRPGLNVAPAIGEDGTVYTVSRTHLAGRWAWLVAVDDDLRPRWSASLRNLFHDGCNVLLPQNGQPGGCREGTTTGVDPFDNQPGSGVAHDSSTASPVVAPDGSIYLGTYSSYNFSQGHIVRFSSTGQFLSAYQFGWDVTPAIWEHDGTFSVITKENRYNAGQRRPGDGEGYYITQLSPDLEVEWKLKSTNTESCTRLPNGSLSCVEDHWNGFEWCVNSLAVDARGVVYVNSEDGNLYAINQGGTVRERIFLQTALGAAYTPLSLGSDGKIYTQNAGILFVVGSDAPRRRAARK
jgi:outer membrane protein assembly factor BamB